MKRLLLFAALGLAEGCAHAPPVEVAAPAAAPETAPTEAVGHIAWIDPFSHELAVATGTTELRLRAGPDAELMDDSGVGWLHLGDVHPGDEVRVSWRPRRDGQRELTELRLLPSRGDPATTEPLPPPRDDEAPLDAPAGGLNPIPLGGR